MAKPDLDDGWYMLSHELDEALSCADFTKAARMVIREVFAQIYGPAKRKVAKVSGSEMGRRWGRDRQYFDRGIAEAVDSLALERDGKGFRFVKDYEKWVIKPRKKGDPIIPRFSKVEISAIDSAPEHAMYFKTEDTRSTCGQRKSGDNQTDDKTVTTKLMTPTTDKQQSDNQNDDTMTTILPQNDNQIDDNMTTRMMTNGAPLVKERANGELETGKLGERDHAPLIRQFDNPTLPLKARVAGPGKDHPDAIALELWALQFGCDPKQNSYGFWAREQCGLMPVEWVRLLLERKVVGASKRPSIFILTSVAADWRAAGEPEYKPGDRSPVPGIPKPPPDESRFHRASGTRRYDAKPKDAS